jgi:hypothetical protein
MYGKYGWLRLSEATGIPWETLRGVARGVDFGSGALAKKIARTYGVPFEWLLNGDVISADRCPRCGQFWPEESF